MKFLREVFTQETILVGVVVLAVIVMIGMAIALIIHDPKIVMWLAIILLAVLATGMITRKVRGEL